MKNRKIETEMGKEGTNLAARCCTCWPGPPGPPASHLSPLPVGRGSTKRARAQAHHASTCLPASPQRNTMSPLSGAVRIEPSLSFVLSHSPSLSSPPLSLTCMAEHHRRCRLQLPRPEPPPLPPPKSRSSASSALSSPSTHAMPDASKCPPRRLLLPRVTEIASAALLASDLL